MTRIDFYLLDTTAADRRLDVVCKLAEKAVGARERVFIHADDEGLLEALDDSLWTFRNSSFVAHAIVSSDGIEAELNADPVQLSCGTPAADRTLLINLSLEVPPFFSRFARTLEVVDESETVRVAGRDRYRFYKDRGYPLKHHKIG